MAGSVERRGEYIKQLSFDIVESIPIYNEDAIQEIPPTKLPAKSKGVDKRPASGRRKAKKPATLPEGIQQHSFEEIFAAIPADTDIPLAKPYRDKRDNHER